MEDERTTNPNKTVVTVITKAPQNRAEDGREGCLVIIYGDDLGRRVPLGPEPTIIGRSSKCDVQLDQESVSRNHARISRQRSNYVIRDLGSTNGTYVNDELVDEVVLRDGDQVKVGRTIFKFIVSGNMEAQYHEEIYRLMTVDGLTEMHNKRYFNEAIEREASRSRRYQRTFSLVLFDIDHFKHINDRYGHAAGDAVLIAFADQLREHFAQPGARVARVGGEEFAVLLRGVDEDAAAALAAAFCRRLASAPLAPDATRGAVTVSIGVGELRDTRRQRLDDFLVAVDRALYRAKAEGRNRVCR